MVATLAKLGIRSGQQLNADARDETMARALNQAPTDAFWSITMYDAQGFLIETPIDRYEIGHIAKPAVDADGLVDLSVQHDPPAGGQSNRLPAPPGDLNLTLRMYWPKQSAIDGTGKPLCGQQGLSQAYDRHRYLDIAGRHGRDLRTRHDGGKSRSPLPRPRRVSPMSGGR